MNKTLCAIGAMCALMLAFVVVMIFRINTLTLANAEMARTLSLQCYSTTLGEMSALMLIDGEITCVKRYDGIPRSVWGRRVPKEKKS